MAQIKLKNSSDFNSTMIKNGFTQRSLAKAAGISDTTLNMLINGKRCVSATVSKKIVKAIGCQFDDIFFIINDCKSDQIA